MLSALKKLYRSIRAIKAPLLFVQMTCISWLLFQLRKNISLRISTSRIHLKPDLLNSSFLRTRTSYWVCSTLLIASKSLSMRNIRLSKCLSILHQPKLFLRLSKESLVTILSLTRTSLFSYQRSYRPWTNGMFINTPWLDLKMRNLSWKKRPKKKSSQKARYLKNYKNGKTSKNTTRVTLL